MYISRMGSSISLCPVLTANTAGSLTVPVTTSTALPPQELIIPIIGGRGGPQPTTITSAPSPSTTAFVSRSNVEPAVSSATAAVDFVTDQIDQLQNSQNDQNLKQDVLSLINQTKNIAHAGGIGRLFGRLGVAASKAEAAVMGTASVADLINAWDNVEKAESDYRSSCSEPSESFSQSEQSQKSEPTQSTTTASASRSSSNSGTALSTAMSASSMSSNSVSVYSSVYSCPSGCTLSQVTLASMAIDPSLSVNPPAILSAAISFVKLMVSNSGNPFAWGVMGHASGTGATSNMPSSIVSVTGPTASATILIASSNTDDVISTLSSDPAQITTIPTSEPTAKSTSPPPLACTLQ